jgi:hypothetical protein
MRAHIVRSGSPAGRAQEGGTKDARLFGGDPARERQVVDVLEAQRHGVRLRREVGMMGESRHVRRESLEGGRVVHHRRVLIPEDIPGGGYTIIECHERSASLTGETSRCHAKTDAGTGNHRRALLRIRG